ncbi:Bor family protein [uncultured Roseivirga sp.]|uniref:Bor family protein n=1 Tax=uncultured Roseivirga sp. TaxID=543088 RepID=UPI0030D87E26
MRKNLVKLSLFLSLSLLMTSCFTYSVVVGEGAQTGVETKKMNHYLIYGLAPVSVADAKQMAGGAENYEVTITHTFIDGLINALTFGIYTPTTTIVKK